MKRMFRIAMSEREMHLENTLLNGQCFNWWKSTKDNKVFEGVFRSYFV